MADNPINTESHEGKLLYAAIVLLMNAGPAETKGKSFGEIYLLLDGAAKELEDFRM